MAVAVWQRQRWKEARGKRGALGGRRKRAWKSLTYMYGQFIIVPSPSMVLGRHAHTPPVLQTPDVDPPVRQQWSATRRTRRSKAKASREALLVGAYLPSECCISRVCSMTSATGKGVRCVVHGSRQGSPMA
jgi:hypothetical protein